MFAMPRYRCAILDDYQNVALNAADWSKVAGDLDIKVFNAHIDGQDNVVKALQGFEIVCAMRERTAFPRAVIEKLPKLKLLITTGMRNASIDVVAATERGVAVCGTGSFGSPTAGIAIGLMLELTRRIGQTFTLAELAALYQGSDRWALETIDDAFPGERPGNVSTAADAAFDLYARRASDYEP